MPSKNIWFIAPKLGFVTLSLLVSLKSHDLRTYISQFHIHALKNDCSCKTSVHSSGHTMSGRGHSVDWRGSKRLSGQLWITSLLNGLTLLHIHQDIQIDIQAAANNFRPKSNGSSKRVWKTRTREMILYLIEVIHVLKNVVHNRCKGTFWTAYTRARPSKRA